MTEELAAVQSMTGTAQRRNCFTDVNAGLDGLGLKLECGSLCKYDGEKGWTLSLSHYFNVCGNLYIFLKYAGTKLLPSCLTI